MRALVLSLVAILPGAWSAIGKEPLDNQQNTGAYAYQFDGIAGDPQSLSEYAGKVVLVVNTASRCGYTGQYDALQTLYDTQGDQGLVVLGVPSNSFNQELATEAEVKEFCEVRFDLTFPMTAITPVKGEESHPFFDWVRAESGQTGFPKWNFNKALIGRDGQLLGAYGSGSMLSRNKLQKDLVEAIEAALAAEAA